MNRNIHIAIAMDGETYAEACAVIMNDPGTSDWLKRAVLASSRRDPCDVVGDVSMLMMLATQRIEEIERAAQQSGAAASAAIAKAAS